MKFSAILLFIMCTVFATSSSYSQSTTTVQDILETATKKVVELEEQRNQEIVNFTVDLLVNQGKKTVLRFLDPSFDYDVLVIGDRRIESLKITVNKRNSQTGELTYVDEFSAANPLIRLDPSDFEQYEFTVTVDKFRIGDSAGHFALILYHQNPERGK